MDGEKTREVLRRDSSTSSEREQISNALLSAHSHHQVCFELLSSRANWGRLDREIRKPRATYTCPKLQPLVRGEMTKYEVHFALTLGEVWGRATEIKSSPENRKTIQ